MVYVGLSYYGPALGNNEYLSFLLSSLVEIPSYLACWVVMDWWGRRWPLSICMILSGISCIVTVLLPEGMYLTNQLTQYSWSSNCKWRALFVLFFCYRCSDCHISAFSIFKVCHICFIFNHLPLRWGIIPNSDEGGWNWCLWIHSRTWSDSNPFHHLSGKGTYLCFCRYTYLMFFFVKLPVCWLFRVEKIWYCPLS